MRTSEAKPQQPRGCESWPQPPLVPYGPKRSRVRGEPTAPPLDAAAGSMIMHWSIAGRFFCLSKARVTHSRPSGSTATSCATSSSAMVRSFGP